MKQLAYTDILVFFLRIFLKSLGIYVIFNLSLDPQVVLYSIILIIVSEVYEIPAAIIAHKSLRYRAVTYLIIGLVNNGLVIGLLYLANSIASDLYFFIAATVIGVSIAGGLFAGTLTSVASAVAYLLLSFHFGLNSLDASIRSVFILFSGTIVGLLAEMYYHQQEYVQKIEEDKTQKKQTQSIKEKFITAASHHLRTPLTVIKGFTEILSNDDISNVDKHEAQQKIIQQVNELDTLIEQLIHLANLQTLTDRLNLETSSLHTFLNEMLQTFADLAEQKEIDFKYHPNLDIGPLDIEFDPHQLKIALTNILSNAIKFTSSDGKIVVKTAASSTQVFITISDTGLGISPEDLEHLFTLFYQAGPLLAPKEGTGVGLFISHEIIKAHGGTIRVQSKLGKGTTFIISLPKSSMHQFMKEL